MAGAPIYHRIAILGEPCFFEQDPRFRRKYRMASTTCLLHNCFLDSIRSYWNKHLVGSILSSSLSLSHVHAKTTLLDECPADVAQRLNLLRQIRFLSEFVQGSPRRVFGLHA